MIRHTVLMPFARLRFAGILRDHMRDQKVEWRPLHDVNALVLDGDDGKETRIGWSFTSNNFYTDPKDAEWIKPWRCEGKAEYNIGHWVVDRFLDAMVEEDKKAGHYPPGSSGHTPGRGFYCAEHYVSFMCDDCLWNHKYWLKLRSYFEPANTERGWQQAPQLQSPKVIVSGYHGVGGMEQPPTYKKVVNWEDWRSNSCRNFCTMFEVLTVRADLLRDVRFGPLWCADGMVMERLVEDHGMTPAYACMVYKEGLFPHKYGFPSTHQR